MPKTRISVTTMSEQGCQEFIKLMTDRYDGAGKLHDRIRWRRNHFHNTDAANPGVNLPEPYNKGPQYQTDIPRQLHMELKTATCENSWAIRVNSPKSTAIMEQASTDVERAMQSGIDRVEKRAGFRIQDDLAYGQIIDCFGVLHWSMAEHLIPEVPDNEYLEDLPKDVEERKRFKTRREKVGENAGKYRETEESVRSRYRQTAARAGFPWWVEVVDPITFYWQPDRSLANGIARVLVIREVGLSEYEYDLRENDGVVLSLNEVNGKLRVYGEQDAPPPDSPSGATWGRKVGVATIWTRDEFYELVTEHPVAYGDANVAGDWVLVKSGTHPYGMPPFAIAHAARVKNPDPALAYEPALEGVFRIKPFLDHDMALLHVVKEMIALPYYYLESVASGEPWLDESGNVITLTRDSVLAKKIPAGYTLKKLDFELNQAFVMGVNLMREDMEAAKPPTGQADAQGTSQPWTVRLLLQQARQFPSLLVRNQALAMTTMVQNMTMVHSLPAEEGGFGEPVYVYAKDTKTGTLDMTTAIAIEPDMVKTLDVAVDIKALSAAEQLTLEQHGRELLNDDRVPITPRMYVEDYMGDANPQDRIAEWQAWKIFDGMVLPGLQKQQVAKRFGTRVVMGLNGEMVGPDGQQVQPQQVLQAQGWQSAAPQGGPGVAAGQVTMGAMPAIATPGAIPMQGGM